MSGDNRVPVGGLAVAQDLTSPVKAVDAALTPHDTQRRFRLMRWVARRCLCCLATMFWTFIAAGLLSDWYNSPKVWPGKDSVIWWVIYPDSTLRVRRVAAISLALGLLIPDCRLPPWLTRTVIGMLAGMLAGVFGTLILDSTMALRAVTQAYAPFADVRLPDHLDRPLPYQKFYPSAYRIVFSRVLVQGAILGLLVGAAWSLRQRTRVSLLALITLTAIVLVWDLQRNLSITFDGYVIRQQHWIREWQNSRRVDPKALPIEPRKMD